MPDASPPRRHAQHEANRQSNRPGDVTLDFDPAALPGDAHLVFIGRVRSPWTDRSDMPKNPAEARARRQTASIAIEAAYRPGLRGLAAYSHVFVIAWLHASRRDVIVHTPRHRDGPTGVFAARTPIRPNPLGLSAARIVSVDEEQGIVEIDAIDFLDGTPVVDLKPYRPGVDAIPEALIG